MGISRLILDKTDFTGKNSERQRKHTYNKQGENSIAITKRMILNVYVPNVDTFNSQTKGHRLLRSGYVCVSNGFLKGGPERPLTEILKVKSKL